MDCDLDRGNPIFEGQVPVKLEGLASSNSVIRSREDRDAKVIIRVLSGSAKVSMCLCEIASNFVADRDFGR